jgi:hypothetical protein
LVPLADGSGFLPIRGYYDLNPTGKRHWSNRDAGNDAARIPAAAIAEDGRALDAGGEAVMK